MLNLNAIFTLCEAEVDTILLFHHNSIMLTTMTKLKTLEDLEFFWSLDLLPPPGFLKLFQIFSFSHKILVDSRSFKFPKFQLHANKIIKSKDYLPILGCF